MQDIADSLGLSRNTVSKAFNNTGVIAESTKDLILRKAAEMGYKNSTGSAMPYAIPIASDKKEIAMLTCYIPGGSHFAVTTIDRIQQNLSSCGYSLTFYRVTQSELMDLRLPGSFSPDKVAAIFCMELFNYEYCEMLCSLPIPLLFIDTPVKPGRSPLMPDTLFMENQAGIYSFVSQIAEKGKKSVGFVGDMLHCRSFFERAGACITAAAVFGLEPAEKYSIPAFPPSKMQLQPANYITYADMLYSALQNLSKLPDAFICANDFIAINLISSLRRMDIRCPDDVLVMGFDDSPESRYHAPALTTVHIHTQVMGDIASELILGRIADPNREPRTVYVPTELILRESTQMK
jgi:LacI family transcriptional regulator